MYKFQFAGQINQNLKGADNMKMAVIFVVAVAIAAIGIVLSNQWIGAKCS